MYHYVQKKILGQKYAKYLHYKKFEKQIIYFKKNFEFFNCLNLENFYSKDNFNNKIFLTFDDSLKSHYEYVFKILKKHNLNGIFYIPTLPYMKQKILDVHKIHLIQNYFGEEKAYYSLKKFVEVKMIDVKEREFFKKKIYKKQKNSFKKNYFKKFLNYYVKDKYKNFLIEKLFNNFFPDLNEKKYCKEFYLTEKEINEMSKNGMIFGGHTITHPVLSKLTYEEMEKEIKLSIDFINNLSPYKTFAYPYGGFHTFNKDSEKILNNIGVKFSMNVQSKEISQNDIVFRPHALPRFDCNQFPYGKI